jgi:hypothetical protein
MASLLEEIDATSQCILSNVSLWARNSSVPRLHPMKEMKMKTIQMPSEVLISMILTSSNDEDGFSRRHIKC